MLPESVAARRSEPIICGILAAVIQSALGCLLQNKNTLKNQGTFANVLQREKYTSPENGNIVTEKVFHCIFVLEAF